MIATFVLISALVNRPAAAGFSSLRYDRPRVEVWTNRGDDPYHTGQNARVYLRADRDAYVTLFRIDTDGRVRVIYPREPWEDNFVRGGHEFEVDGDHSEEAFEIDDYPGVGYVFVVAAADPFDYAPITSGDRWDYRAIAEGRVRGDPYVALTDLAQRIVPTGYGEWDYDMAPYYVERRYDYPRFLCYDCHSYASYRYWDPYAYSCVRFRIVIFDDPYYYPYRYYGGTRVVFTRPFRPEPRFIFKDRNGVGEDRFVTREGERPVNDDSRRGIRGTDLGWRGTVPVPDVGERRRSGRLDDPPPRSERPEDRRRLEQPAPRDDRRGGSERRRPDPQGPERRPDRPTRLGEDRRRPPEWIDRPDIRQPESGARDRGRDTPRPEVGRERQQDEPGAERGAATEPRHEPPPTKAPRAEPQRERSGTVSRRDREAAPSRGRSSGQPELRRRRP